MWKNILKMLLPQSVRFQLRGMEKFVRYTSRRIAIIWPVLTNKPLKIIVGAALTYQRGWYSTNEQWLDITSENHWEKIFKGKALITHVVAEHVFEHLTPEESRKALALIAKHMMPGGRIRIAVPDGYHPDPEYIRHIGINGMGADASDHKQLLTADSLGSLLRNAGFDTTLIEGYQKNGTLVQCTWDQSHGFIHRSRKNAANATELPQGGGWDFTDANTSLIIDGIKIS